MVRAAIIAGMAQAWPESRGRKLRPESPNHPSGRWSITAARARLPRVLQCADDQEEDEDLRNEGEERPQAGEDAVANEVLHQARGQQAADEAAGRRLPRCGPPPSAGWPR